MATRTPATTPTNRAVPSPLEWEYAPAPEARHNVSLEEPYGLYIGGDWLEAKEHFTTISPRDESPLAEVAQVGVADVETAVAAASRLRLARGSGSRRRPLRPRSI